MPICNKFVIVLKQQLLHYNTDKNNGNQPLKKVSAFLKTIIYVLYKKNKNNIKSLKKNFQKRHTQVITRQFTIRVKEKKKQYARSKQIVFKFRFYLFLIF